MSAMSLKAVRFLLAPAEVGERMAGGGAAPLSG
jgi:hypothetical protein